MIEHTVNLADGRSLSYRLWGSPMHNQSSTYTVSPAAVTNSN
jgi:hypothetical protein